jgi:excisionase family DNA binding protein
MEYRQATVKDAAHELGVSTRTVERRIQSGDLPSEAVNGRRYVLLPPDTDEPTPTDNTDTDGLPNSLDPRTAAWFISDIRRTWNEAIADLPDHLRADIEALSYEYNQDRSLPSGNTSQATTNPHEERLHAVEADRDHWRHEAQQLQQRLAEVTATLYRLGDQKVLQAPQVEPRPWWAFWRRNQPRQTLT